MRPQRRAVGLDLAAVHVEPDVGEDVVLERALMMGADFYEDDDDHQYNYQLGIPDVGIGRGSFIRKAIIDKNAHIGEEVRILNEERVPGVDEINRDIVSNLKVTVQTKEPLEGTVDGIVEGDGVETVVTS